MQTLSCRRCWPARFRRCWRQPGGRADGRAVLQGPAMTHGGRHFAGRHQRHFGAVCRTPSRPLHPRQPDFHGAEHAGRRRPLLRQPPLQRRPSMTALSSPSSSARVPQLAIQGDPNVNFDPRKFTWLGSLSSYADDAYLMLIMATNPVKSVDDLQEARHARSRSAATTRHRATSSSPPIAKDVLGLNINIVRGYHRRRADVPRHAARRDRRPDHRLQLDPHRPARFVDAEGVPAADAIRAHQAACRTSPTSRPAAN